VNPYKEQKKIYDMMTKDAYHQAQPFKLVPHLYSLAENSFRNMVDTGKPQAIIITGESGSGKTVNAKLILEYLSAVSVSGVVTDNIKKILVETQPLLEAFGNAKTLRNDNSSRFGKNLELYFNFKGQLEGGNILTW
jgi:myosin I